MIPNQSSQNVFEEVRTVQDGHRTYRVNVQADSLRAYVRPVGKSINIDCAVTERDGERLIVVDARAWAPGDQYELHCQAYDAQGRCLSHSHTDIELVQPRYASDSGIAPAQHGTALVRIVLEGTPDASDFHVRGEDAACHDVDLAGVEITAHFEQEEGGCCQDLGRVTKVNNGKTMVFVSVPDSVRPGTLRVSARKGNLAPLSASKPLAVRAAPTGDPILVGTPGAGGLAPMPGRISLSRPERRPTENQDFYTLIRASSNALSFRSYELFMDLVFCRESSVRSNDKAIFDAATKSRASQLALPFPGVDPYRTLKAATEVFMLLCAGMVNAGVTPNPAAFKFPDAPTLEDETARAGHPLPPGSLDKRLEKYLVTTREGFNTLPYLELIRGRLTGIDITETDGPGTLNCSGIIQSKLTNPLLIELIWSYWMEEAMLVQTLMAISQRFQNRQANGERDPLAQLEIDPLRPFSNFLWGYVQDEQHRLSVVRRANEYSHQYGLVLQGKAMRNVRSVDRRSKFLEAFHNLLHQCVQFFRQDDDTTVIADGFAVLNAVKETHYVLAQGAHNQFGDLPATARQEMLIEQWMLARPEVREFLGGRVMVPYPEAWMDRVDAVKTMKGWTDVSVVHFRDLAVFGEQVLLSIRWDSWSRRNDPDFAANWARSWRPEIQGYIHAYRVATGIDLTAEVTDRAQLTERFLPPSVHLSRRLASQLQQRA